MLLEKLQKDAEAAERAERVKRGLPPDHLTDFAHYPFAFALDALARFRDEAASNPDYAAQIAIIDGAFGRAGLGLPVGGELRALPPVEGQYPTEPAFFFSCDAPYFKSLCVPLLMTIAEQSPGVRCHVHLIDSPDEIRSLASKLPLEMTFTREESGLLNADKRDRWNYYNAVRFIRFAEALERNPGPLWISDVDALVTKDVRAMLSTKSPLAMRLRAGRLSPNEQASACLVLGTSRSVAFFQYVSRFLRAKPFFWGIDQFALFSAFVALRPELELIGPETAGVVDDAPGTFWYTAGANKLTLLKDETPYARAFRRAAQAYLDGV